MEGEVIKSFLVGLGFGVDDASLSKFNKAIASASVKVVALYATIQTVATGIFFGISKISEGFEQMGYDLRLIAPMINKTLVLRRELLKAYSMAGINLQKVVVQSVKFNMSLAKTEFALKAIYTSVGAKFFPLLTKNMDIFRKKLYESMPTIQAGLEKFVNFVFKAFDATVILGTRVWEILTRVYDFFLMLDKATDGWSTVILGVVAAWKFLNLAFLATPLGFILTGLLAILALWDDYEVWREGGKSLFNWSSFVPVIDAVGSALKNLRGIIDDIFTVIFNLGAAIYDFFTGNFSSAADHVKEVFQSVLDIISRLWENLKNIVNVGGAVGAWVSGLFGGKGANVAANLQNNPVSNPQSQTPTGVNNVANSQQTNQHVQQQTTINVNGAADAQSTGRAVASEQNRVNFDMARNMGTAAQ